MNADSSPGDLKNRLPHTWPVFFAKHGNFTDIQLLAIPPILNGENSLVMAATAAGKTEATIAPLLERHLLSAASFVKDPAVGYSTDSSKGSNSVEADLRILYLSPTRALVRDLYERLRMPLEALAISLAMKSGDTGPLTRLPSVLITTPESTDSLLTRTARSFAQLQAVIIDEIHLFDGGPRGDQVRCLLNRIEIIRSYYYRQTLQIEPLLNRHPQLQRVALSATVSNPVGVASRYLASDEQDPAIVEVGGGRSLDAEIFPALELEDVAKALLWRAWGDPPARKSLLFCNTRREVEQTAAYLRRNLGFEAAVFVHYSNLDPTMRRAVEEDFAQAGTAVCVCTSTLELGIDIGSIDDVVLAGPPPSLGSFMQRIGRGNRRSNVSRVLCLARDPLEEIQFRALVELAGGSVATATATVGPKTAGANTEEIEPVIGSSTRNAKTDFQPGYFFRPSVLIQQVFSLLKQSPTGSVRLADLRRLSPVDLGDDNLHNILDELVQQDFLRLGRPNEWRPGAELDLLLDAHEIYSNIGSDPLSVLIVDDYSGRSLARMERSQVRGPTLQLGGRTWAVAWRDRYRIGLRMGGKGIPDETFNPGATPMTLSLPMGQAVAGHFGVAWPMLPVIQDLHGTWVCHFWGDLYGRWLAAMLQGKHAHSAAHVEVINAHVLYVHGRVRRLPPWDEELALRHLRVLAPEAIPFLNLGRFHSLLPPTLAWQTVLATCDLPRFGQLYRQAELVHATDELAGPLQALL
jgi:superfamily II DNA/RNA helicase